MSVFRRRRGEANDAPAEATRSLRSEQQAALPATAPDAAAPTSTQPVAPLLEGRVPAHVERALITLTTKMQHCIERLESIEHRIDELTDAAMHAPSHSDVLEVRLHSAKLAAELARATVELRGEIGMASDEARRAARSARNAAESAEAQTNLASEASIDISETVEAKKTVAAADEDEGNHPLRGNWTQSA